MRFKPGIAVFAAVMAMVFATSASALSYGEDFEGMDPLDPEVLGNAGWLVGGVVFNSSVNGDYDYFAFPAPNNGLAFSGVATGEGGPSQGDNQLVVYGDYQNLDHADDTAQLTAVMFNNVGRFEDSDVGLTYNFSFDVKQGNIADPSYADVFMVVQKTSDSSFDELARTSVEVEYIGDEWVRLALAVTIEESFVGESLIIGFQNTTFGVGAGNDYNPTGMFYDNLLVTAVPLPGAVWFMLSGLAVLVGRRRT